jgi:hypothetical protein
MSQPSGVGFNPVRRLMPVNSPPGKVNGAWPATPQVSPGQPHGESHAPPNMAAEHPDSAAARAGNDIRASRDWPTWPACPRLPDPGAQVSGCPSAAGCRRGSSRRPPRPARGTMTRRATVSFATGWVRLIVSSQSALQARDKWLRCVHLTWMRALRSFGFTNGAPAAPVIDWYAPKSRT